MPSANREITLKPQNSREQYRLIDLGDTIQLTSVDYPYSKSFFEFPSELAPAIAKFLLNKED